jgi:DNA-directed RNA polymerase specialized sigma24 family protein
VAANRFTQLEGRDELWRLLVTITVRKAIDHVQRHGRLRRGGGRVLGEADLGAAGRDEPGHRLDWLASDEPTPELIVLLDEEYNRLFQLLPDTSHREVARLRLEGYTGEEIADRLGCNRRTVTRKLELIRRSWSESTS